jgi:hypothetical protein
LRHEKSRAWTILIQHLLFLKSFFQAIGLEMGQRKVATTKTHESHHVGQNRRCVKAYSISPASIPRRRGITTSARGFLMNQGGLNAWRYALTANDSYVAKGWIGITASHDVVLRPADNDRSSFTGRPGASSWPQN